MQHMFALMVVMTMMLAGCQAGRHHRAERHCEEANRELSMEPGRKHILSPARIGNWWLEFWDPTWSCPFERKLKNVVTPTRKWPQPIGEGGKWVCDVPVLASQDSCLVYSFGSHGDLSFEEGVLAAIPHCEIHVFDFFDYGAASKGNIHFHTAGVAGRTYHHSFDKAAANLKGMTFPKEGVDMMSIPDLVRELGHGGRTIDVLKIDVEGSEYGILDNPDMWSGLKELGTDVRQIQLELHLAAIGKDSLLWVDKTFVTGEDADKLLRTLTENGFAMFHKEVNTHPSANLYGCEMSFVRVDIKCDGPNVVMPVPDSPYNLQHHNHHGRPEFPGGAGGGATVKATNVVREPLVGGGGGGATVKATNVVQEPLRLRTR